MKNKIIILFVLSVLVISCRTLKSSYDSYSIAIENGDSINFLSKIDIVKYLKNITDNEFKKGTESDFIEIKLFFKNVNKEDQYEFYGVVTNNDIIKTKISRKLKRKKIFLDNKTIAKRNTKELFILTLGFSK